MENKGQKPLGSRLETGAWAAAKVIDFGKPRVNEDTRKAEDTAVEAYKGEGGKTRFVHYLNSQVNDLHILQRQKESGKAEDIISYFMGVGRFLWNLESWRDAELIDQDIVKRFDPGLKRHDISLAEKPTETTEIKSRNKERSSNGRFKIFKRL